MCGGIIFEGGFNACGLKTWGGTNPPRDRPWDSSQKGESGPSESSSIVKRSAVKKVNDLRGEVWGKARGRTERTWLPIGGPVHLRKPV